MARSREEFLGLIEQNRERIKRLGVRRPWLFGSCARGKATANSDLDFVVEFTAKPFDTYMDLKAFLEGLFGRRVDLVLAETVKPRLRSIIQRETAYATGL